MITVQVNKAGSITDQPVQSAAIVMEVEMPGGPKMSLRELEDRYEEDAAALYTVLRDTLPGGTLVRLTGHMLQHFGKRMLLRITDKE